MPKPPDHPWADPPAVPPSPAVRAALASRDLGRIISEARFELVCIEEAAGDLVDRARVLRLAIAAGGDRQSELQAATDQLDQLLGCWSAVDGRLAHAAELAARPAAK